MRCGGDRVGALADAADDLALGHGAASHDLGRVQLEQRDCVAVAGLDRDRAAACRDGADERNDAAGGRAYGLAHGGADVDPAMLAGGVRIGAEGVGPQNGPVDGPGPAGRGRNDEQRRNRDRDRGGERTPH